MVENTEDTALRRALRSTLLFAIALSLMLIALPVSLYPPLLDLPGGWVSGAEAVVLLVVHASFLIWATRSANGLGWAVLSRAALFGLISATVEAVHISMETFVHLNARAATISTGAFMLSLFLVWAIAGYSAARSRISLGWRAGLGSATFAMLLVSAFGLLLLNLCPHRLELNNIGSPDLIRSGWTDLRAFTIADIFEAVVKVLTIGPILGAVFGGIGGLLAWAQSHLLHSRNAASDP
jgi:hypothetical protein